jgi:hypothetical protein
VAAAGALHGGLFARRGIGRRWAWLLVLATLAAGALVRWARAGMCARQLLPAERPGRADARHLAARLHQRLALADPAEELLPWIEQFNALMQRLEQAYAQLEGFNADVAHELRTPLATLIGQTEVALSRERPAESLRDTLLSNLEEMQRLSAMVNDMLFLSQADRGAVARRGQPVSLAALARRWWSSTKGTLEDAGLRCRCRATPRWRWTSRWSSGRCPTCWATPRALPTRLSTVVVHIGPEAGRRPTVGEVQVVVCNAAAPSTAQRCRACSTASSAPTRRAAATTAAPRAGPGHRGGHRAHARRAHAGPGIARSAGGAPAAAGRRTTTRCLHREPDGAQTLTWSGRWPCRAR